MKKALEDGLKAKFPDLFVLSSDTYQVCADIGDGWEKLVEDMCKDLDNVSGRPVDQRIVSLRRKLGVLVFHIAPITPEAWAIGLAAQGLSKITCEECGKEGKGRQKHDSYDGYTQCDKCHEEKKLKDE